jgi:hypothetical protein
MPDFSHKFQRAYESNFRREYARRYVQLERATTPEPQQHLPSVRLGFAALVAMRQRQIAKRAAQTRSSRLDDYLTSPVSTETDILSY